MSLDARFVEKGKKEVRNEKREGGLGAARAQGRGKNSRLSVDRRAFRKLINTMQRFTDLKPSPN